MFKYYKNALTDSLCEEYKGYWRSNMNNKYELTKLALQQQSLPHVMTYAYNGRGLTKKYLLDNFGNYINGNEVFFDVEGVKGYTYSMWVGQRKKMFFVTEDVNAYLFCDDLSLEVSGSKCPTLYIGCKSNVSIYCNGYNTINVYLFDESVLEIAEADESCSITVLKYSDKCRVLEGEFCLSKKIKTFDKELRL